VPRAAFAVMLGVKHCMLPYSARPTWICRRPPHPLSDPRHLEATARPRRQDVSRATRLLSKGLRLAAEEFLGRVTLGCEMWVGFRAA